MKVYKSSLCPYATIIQIPNNEIERLNFDICKQPRETLESYYKRQTVKPNVLVNAGLFNMQTGNAVGTLMIDGKTYSASSKHRTGLGIVPSDTKHLVFDKVDNRKWTDFVNGYPVLVENGRATTITYAQELNYRTRRTVLGYNSAAVYIICVDKPGMNYAQLQKLCTSLGISYAINLDGGGSTRLLVNGVRKTNLAANRAVDSVFAVYTKIDERKRDYKVEVTAKKLNIRSGPGANYALEGTLVKGVKCHILAEADGTPGSAPLWGKLDDGRGWIAIGNGYTKKI